MTTGYAGFAFTLDSGREVYVDLIEIETATPEVSGHDTNPLPLLIRRRGLNCGEDNWFEPAEMHLILEDRYLEPEGVPGTVMFSALLWSEPIKPGFGFPELYLSMLTEFNINMSIRQILEVGLHDLDWDEVAIDRCGFIAIDPAPS